jgi:hypothetical protein
VRPAAAGDLQVILVNGGNGAPSPTLYTLLTTNGTRYSLSSLPAGQWRTGMRVRVTGVKAASPQANAMGPTSSSVSVIGVSVLSTTTTARGVASTTTAPLVGYAPSTMGVLFIIVTMCSQAAAITPTVSYRLQQMTCVLRDALWHSAVCAAAGHHCFH